MNTELKKRVQERYSALLTERDEFVSKANQKLGEYAGRLAELEEVFKQFLEVETENGVGSVLTEPILNIVDEPFVEGGFVR